MKTKLLLCLLVMLSMINICIAQVKADDIIGVWLTAGKEPVKVQIYKSGHKYYGKIIWLKNPLDIGKPKLDTNNPGKNKKNQPIIGLVILKDFRFDRDDKWEDGETYDPESGQTYSCSITLKDSNNLKVRGFIGISMFGRTETWTRTN